MSKLTANIIIHLANILEAIGEDLGDTQGQTLVEVSHILRALAEDAPPFK